jgi:hypothetical protein
MNTTCGLEVLLSPSSPHWLDMLQRGCMAIPVEQGDSTPSLSHAPFFRGSRQWRMLALWLVLCAMQQHITIK